MWCILQIMLRDQHGLHRMLWYSIPCGFNLSLLRSIFFLILSLWGDSLLLIHGCIPPHRAQKFNLLFSLHIWLPSEWNLLHLKPHRFLDFHLHISNPIRKFFRYRLFSRWKHFDTHINIPHKLFSTIGVCYFYPQLAIHELFWWLCPELKIPYNTTEF